MPPLLLSTPETAGKVFTAFDQVLLAERMDAEQVGFRSEGLLLSVKFFGSITLLMPLCKIISTPNMANRMITDNVYLLLSKPFFIKAFVLSQISTAFSKEKPALIFLLKLVLLLTLLKTIFFLYNFGETGRPAGSGEFVKILKWSFYYDLIFSSICLLPFFMALWLGKKLQAVKVACMYLSCALVLLMLLLNAVDIFYFPFHRQRADADLFYVLRNPLANSSGKVWLILIAGLILLFLASWFWLRQFRKLRLRYINAAPFATGIFMLLLVASMLAGGYKYLLPTRSLTQLPGDKLPVVQNSLHSFLYSLYRSENVKLPAAGFLPEEERASLFNITTQNKNVSAPKNIVLFIMESVPYDFFDTSNHHRSALPFFDSLLNHATLYNHAFSYSYSSNKGITAILSGIPTITDIPLYHSGFINIRKTAIGTRLAEKKYSSSFFIGDNYDDFGFAKCCNWVGIQHYYSMQDIPGYKKMEKHSMGLHDEYVLDFMQQKLKEMPPPFFATQYNISTHYPNDLPAAFAGRVKGLKASPAQKSMLYYDLCLQQFFAKAKQEPWYSNTVFIFCSDHWAAPVDPTAAPDMVNSFRIPIIIFDPSIDQKQIITNPVSQLDIMNTVLSYAGDQQPFLSYGQSLADSTAKDRVVFTKTNNAVYQAISDSLVLGFDVEAGRPVYAYNYQLDPAKKKNLLNNTTYPVAMMEKKIKAFLQTAVEHYKSVGQKSRN